MSKVLTIMAVCAGLAVLTIGSCAGLLYMGFRNTNTAVTPRIETLLSAIQNDRFGETNDTETTAELRSTLTREQYETLGRANRLRPEALPP